MGVDARKGWHLDTKQTCHPNSLAHRLIPTLTWRTQAKNPLWLLSTLCVLCYYILIPLLQNLQPMTSAHNGQPLDLLATVHRGAFDLFCCPSKRTSSLHAVLFLVLAWNLTARQHSCVSLVMGKKTGPEKLNNSQCMD